MQIVQEISLLDFEFWAGARFTADRLTADEMETIEAYLSELDRPFEAVEINDFFWFEDDLIAEILGYDDAEKMFEVLLKRGERK